jgi:pimeloyl-ACP methyl ester carboxylesterase
LVVIATRVGFQFSVGEAEKSVGRARTVFRLYGVDEKLHHAIFDSGHDYNQAMREAMYGWMTKWLKNEGEGKPIPEPKHTIETPADLQALPVEARPKGFLFPPTFAAREAATLLAKFTKGKPDHSQEWESSAVFMRDQLRRQVFGDFPKLPRPVAEMDKPEIVDQITATRLLLESEPGLRLPAILKSGVQRAPGRQPACVLLHLDGKAEAIQHPLVPALLAKGWAILAPDLRATGETRPAKDAIGGARDHNSAEQALWIGRPLLGQWVFDVLCVLDWLAFQPSIDPRRFAVVGLGQAGIVALCAAGLFKDRVTTGAALRTPTTYITQQAYAPGTSMGLLAPGILRLGDMPQLAALVAPRRLLLVDGVTPQGKKLTEQYLREAYAFTRDIYKLYKADAKLTVTEGGRIEDIAAGL